VNDFEFLEMLLRLRVGVER